MSTPSNPSPPAPKHLSEVLELERLDTVSLLAELALLLLHLARLGPRTRQSVTTGSIGQVYKVGVLGVGIATPLLLQLGSLLSRKTSRPLTALTACLVLLGGFLLRYVMVVGGMRSADDPAATFETTS